MHVAGERLFVDFAGHGVLLGPGAEYWLLSGAGENGSEAVNLLRASEDARNSGIAHVVFISDACRSYAAGPPWSSLLGGVIFRSGVDRPNRSDIDIFFATRPALPAIEAPEQADNSASYRGLFTANLLQAVNAPQRDWLVEVQDGRAQLTVIPSRPLRPFLEQAVSAAATAVDIRLRQVPEIRVESAPPEFFATVAAAAAAAPAAPPAAPPAPAPPPPPGTTLGDEPVPVGDAAPDGDGAGDDAADGDAGGGDAATGGDVAGVVGVAPEPGFWDQVRSLGVEAGNVAGQHLRAYGLREEKGAILEREFDRLLINSRVEPVAQTGFTVIGASRVKAFARGWQADARPAAEYDVERPHWHVSLRPSPAAGNAVLIEFGEEHSTLLPVFADFHGVVDIAQDRVANVNYIPSPGTSRYDEYRQRADELEALKALTAVATRDGRLVFDDVDANQLAGRIRQAKGIDPTMGLYAAYAYAQVGKYDQALSVYRYMKDDEQQLPLLFDVVMLASRQAPQIVEMSRARIAPLAPLLGTGWSLLLPGDALYLDVHGELRQHLLPSLWTTYDAEGTYIARRLLKEGRLG